MEPDVVLQNKGVLPQIKDKAIKETKLRDELRGLLVPVGKHEPRVISEEIKDNIEKFAVPENGIDPKIQSIRNDVVQYFRHQASGEGLIEEGQFELKVLFVRKGFFPDEDTVKGYYFPLERMVVVLYPENLDQFGIFQVSTVLFHECRHAVSRQRGVIRIKPDQTANSTDELEYDSIDVLAGMDKMSMSSSKDLLEEIYTEGYTATNIKNIDNPFVAESIKFVTANAIKQGLDPKLITTFLRVDDSAVFKTTEYTHILQIFFLLRDEICLKFSLMYELVKPVLGTS